MKITDVFLKYRKRVNGEWTELLYPLDDIIASSEQPADLDLGGKLVPFDNKLYNVIGDEIK